MNTSRKQIADVINDMILKPGISTQKLGHDIAAYLLTEKLTGELDSLMRDLIARRADKGIFEVTVVSARELPAEVRDKVEQQVQNYFPNAKKIIINERIDRSQIGGVRLEMVDRQVDLTVRSKLNRLRELTS